MKIINDRADAFIDEIFEKKKTEDSNIRESKKTTAKKRKQKIHEKKKTKVLAKD